MTYKAQSQMILEYMAQGHRISPLEALNKFGCLRLGARIYDLKNEGHNIITEMVSENAQCGLMSMSLFTWRRTDGTHTIN